MPDEKLKAMFGYVTEADGRPVVVETVVSTIGDDYELSDDQMRMTLEVRLKGAAFESITRLRKASGYQREVFWDSCLQNGFHMHFIDVAIRAPEKAR